MDIVEGLDAVGDEMARSGSSLFKESLGYEGVERSLIAKLLS
jgi:hypothetical protein